MAVKMRELRRIRREQEMSQKELAERAGVSLTAVQGAEHGSHSPRIQTVEKMAEALGVSLHDVLPPKSDEEAQIDELTLDRMLGADNEDRHLALQASTQEERDRLQDEVEEELSNLEERYAKARNEDERHAIWEFANRVSAMGALARFGPAVLHSERTHPRTKGHVKVT